MGLRLNLWRAGNGFTRIYLNGLPVEGKAWLQASRGRTAVHADGMDGPEVLRLVGEAAGCDPSDWDVLVASVEAMPAPGRGGAAGSRASSRRATYAAPPEAWTASDASALDPDSMTHPLTKETVLLVDDREPAEMVDRLRAVKNLNVEIGSLETGDYAVPDTIYIERKTAADLAASVIGDSKRLFRQTDRMAASGAKGVLLLEGDVYRQTNMSLASISGTLSYLSAIQGVSIVPTISLEHSAYMIVKLVRHACEGLGYDLGLRGAGPKDPGLAAAYVMEGIPGVSAATAKLLHARFGSVAGLAAAAYDDLLEVPGIGPKRARAIHDTMNARPPG